MLFCLPRVDQKYGSFGIHHATAHTACAIVAANAFHGFLALDAAGTKRVDAPLDDILTADDYFFIVEGFATVPYPVVVSFRDWAFPHDQLPSAWKQAAMGLRDDQAQQLLCALTQFSLPLESAHLVPQHELDWFCQNGMRQYNNPVFADMHAPNNLVLLRRDVHAIFDQCRFVIVPKIPPPSDNTTPVFVCHFLNVSDYYYAHNSLVNGLCFSSAPFLFARFAWAIFMCAKGFVVSCVSRHVRVATVDDNGHRVYENKFMTANDLRAAYGSGGGSITSTPLGSGDGQDDADSSDSENFSWDDRQPKRPRRAQKSSEDKPELAETVATELRQAAAVIVNEVEGEYE